MHHARPIRIVFLSLAAMVFMSSAHAALASTYGSSAYQSGIYSDIGTSTPTPTPATTATPTATPVVGATATPVATAKATATPDTLPDTNADIRSVYLGVILLIGAGILFFLISRSGRGRD